MPEDKTSSTEADQSKASVTREEFEAVLERINQQSGILGKMTKALEKLSPGESKAKTQETDVVQGVEARLKALEEREKKSLEKEGQTRSKIIRNKISRSLVEAGVQPIVADDLSLVLLSREADRFLINDDTEDVSVKAGDEELSLGRWSQLFLMSEKGRPYLGDKKNPNIPLPKKGESSPGTLTPEQALKNSELRQQWKEADPEGYNKATEAYHSPDAILERARAKHKGS
jgi:hypothetical protein